MPPAILVACCHSLLLRSRPGPHHQKDKPGNRSRCSDNMEGFPTIAKLLPVVGQGCHCPSLDHVIDGNFNKQRYEQGHDKTGERGRGQAKRYRSAPGEEQDRHDRQHRNRHENWHNRRKIPDHAVPDCEKHLRFERGNGPARAPRTLRSPGPTERY